MIPKSDLKFALTMGCIVIAIVLRIADVSAPIWYNATHYCANSSRNSSSLKISSVNLPLALIRENIIATDEIRLVHRATTCQYWIQGMCEGSYS